jgi:hypothetical protein
MRVLVRSTVVFLLLGLSAQLASAAALPRRAGKARLGITALSTSLSEDLQQAFEDTVSTEASALTTMDVVTAADVRSFLKISQQQMLMGCKEERCLTEFGNLLDLQQAISGGVQTVGEKYLVSLQLLDMVNGGVVRRVSQECEAKAEALLQTTRLVVPALFGVVGRITLWNQPEQGEIYLNGRIVGKTPTDQPIVVHAPGMHALKVEGPGMTPWRTEIVVNPGMDLRLKAENESFLALEQKAFARRSAGFGLLGGGAASMIAGGVLLGMAGQNDRRLNTMDLRTARQSELDAITQTTLGLFVSGLVTAIVGAAVSGTGIYLLADNPYQQKLKEYAGAQ